MPDKPSAPAAENAASASSSASASNASNGPSSTGAPKRPVPEGNPAFRMMGLPRFRLPSRNWLIFFSVVGSFASAVAYDRYQTRRVREKWCKLVSHIAEEPLSSHTMPRRVTVYLAAPPGDGLRAAREHFHNYVKPVLVAAAMDWDVIEGRKEGDVRYKTAERIRKKRKRSGEGEPVSQEEAEAALTIEGIREKNGTIEFDGIAGDLIIGRHTWKEYIRGLHEGWLGPVDSPQPPEGDPYSQSGPETVPSTDDSGVSSLGDAAVKDSANVLNPSTPDEEPPSQSTNTSDQSPDQAAKDKSQEEKKEEEKPKPRHPPPYIQPAEYQSASASSQTPDVLGPSVGIRFPHILGFRNTPTRIYRFLNRRQLADSVGRDVAAAILASHRPFNAATFQEENSAAGELKDSTEQSHTLAHEERDWWKTTYQPRKEFEESVWIEEMAIDERIASRMRAFQLTAEDEDRAKRIRDGKDELVKKDES